MMRPLWNVQPERKELILMERLQVNMGQHTSRMKKAKVIGKFQVQDQPCVRWDTTSMQEQPPNYQARSAGGH